MKKFTLSAVAVLALGISFAQAAQDPQADFQFVTPQQARADKCGDFISPGNPNAGNKLTMLRIDNKDFPLAEPIDSCQFGSFVKAQGKEIWGFGYHDNGKIAIVNAYNPAPSR